MQTFTKMVFRYYKELGRVKSNWNYVGSWKCLKDREDHSCECLCGFERFAIFPEFESQGSRGFVLKTVNCQLCKIFITN